MSENSLNGLWRSTFDIGMFGSGLLATCWPDKVARAWPLLLSTPSRSPSRVLAPLTPTCAQCLSRGLLSVTSLPFCRAGSKFSFPASGHSSLRSAYLSGLLTVFDPLLYYCARHRQYAWQEEKTKNTKIKRETRVYSLILSPRQYA